MSKPGEVHDKKGVPIYPGDLIRSFHFRGPRRRIFYLYHVAVLANGRLKMIPTNHLDPAFTKSGGVCWLRQSLMPNAEVISGHGPGECLDWTDRVKQRRGE